MAAPSANRSSGLSPTCAEHVLHDLEGRVDLILDGGPAPGGLESTVLDLTRTTPRLLRPGLILPSAIAAIVGQVELRLPAAGPSEPAPSPGMVGMHYAPRTPLECVAADAIALRLQEHHRAGLRIGWLAFGPDDMDAAGCVVLRLPPEPASYASGFYAALHQLDAAGVDRIVVTRPPEGEEWLAVLDRLRRAASRER